ncbi:S-formylglutathione hydrolase FrmB [Williamsia limnetica]|jgi:S-formylglutathione hydrolase FrmB|uniref:S-formylglutathione hydrolase FrmB n=1 Tax=Williamsia limnetica TaxID=882452 RepID=A0A318RI42_WILLI|nr:alpha/beta hydrolase-fold protein [Williamsia limnetica]PYE14596.1 S-formylglutathione hydrolase FrmB [Williamsia limnetica]
MNWLWETSVLDGWLPWTILILGILGLAWLILLFQKVYLLYVVPLAAVVSILLVVLAKWLIEDVWKLFADPIPLNCYVWGGLAVFAVLLLVPRLIRGSGVLGRIVTVLATVFAVTMAFSQINDHFSEYPTVGSVVGINNVKTISLDEARNNDIKTVELGQWKKPSSLPGEGAVITAPIPGATSNFNARPAKIYLPPAYFTEPRPLLPVLVLMAGQPGAPEDWLVGGRLTQTMDQYAAANEGLSPVVVVADATGDELANPLCMDSKLGNVATYLAKDVPDWTKQNLQVDSDPKAWAIGGLSYGGTCSLQMTTNYPEIYPTFLDMSGQLEPTLGDRKRTVDQAFGGDSAKFTAVNPMDIMKTKQFPGVAGAFVVGKDDAEYRPGLTQVFQAAQAAGMDVHFDTVPGGHSFAVWSAGLKLEMPWLGKRLGLP